MEYLDIIMGVMVFIFGTLIGSFLNVVVLRFGKISLNGRSKCFSCSKKLNYYELIPILSFVFQRGRCTKCKSKISYQYIIGEFIMGLLFLGIWFRNTEDYLSKNFLITTLFLFIIISISFVVSVYDFKHKVIPSNFLFAFIALSFLAIFFQDINLGYFSLSLIFSMPDIMFFLSALFLSIPFFLLCFFSKEKLMGYGDPLVILGIGFLLNLNLGLSAVIFAFWIATIFILFFALFKILYKKKLSSKFLKIEIPFTPFLFIGMYVILITNFNFIAFLLS